MKKAIVLLLALAVLGGAAFAQATVAVSLYGDVVLVNQDGEGVFEQWGSGYDVLTIKASKDNYGFNITDGDISSGILGDDAATIRDWAVYYKVFEDKAKFTFGKLRDGTIRMTLPNWYYGANLGATDRITGYGLLANAYPMDGLTLGLNLPYAETAAPVADVLQMADIGAKYVIADVGTLIVLANLDLVAASNIINFGFTYSGMEALTATVLYKGTFATAATHKFAVGVAYDVSEALDVGVEFDAAYGTALAWEVAAGAGYTISDTLYAGFKGKFLSTNAYDVDAWVGYDLGAGFAVEADAGFNGAFHGGLTAYYTVSF